MRRIPALFSIESKISWIRCRKLHLTPQSVRLHRVSHSIRFESLIARAARRTFWVEYFSINNVKSHHFLFVHCVIILFDILIYIFGFIHEFRKLIYGKY